MHDLPKGSRRVASVKIPHLSRILAKSIADKFSLDLNQSTKNSEKCSAIDFEPTSANCCVGGGGGGTQAIIVTRAHIHVHVPVHDCMFKLRTCIGCFFFTSSDFPSSFANLRRSLWGLCFTTLSDMSVNRSNVKTSTRKQKTLHNYVISAF